jgi:hypothetical protein
MNYRERQIRLILKQHEQKWDLERQTLQQDIHNLENSTDIQLFNQEKEKSQRLQTLLDQTIELLGSADIKNLTDLKSILKGQTLKQLLNLYQQKITDQDQALINLAKQKLSNKKEARTLVEQLENNWAQQSAEWNNQEKDYLKRLKNQQKEIKTSKEELDQKNNLLIEKNQAYWKLEREKNQQEEQTQTEKQELNQTITNLTKQGKDKDTLLEKKEANRQTSIQNLLNLAQKDKENRAQEKVQLEANQTRELAEQKTFYENYSPAKTTK